VPPRPVRRPFRILFSAGIGLGLAACATVGGPGGSPPDPAEIPFLEADRARDGGNLDVLVRLGAAYRAAGRLNEARSTLEQAVQFAPTHGGAILHLALTYEELEAWSDAAVAYGEYARVGESAALRTQSQRRIPVMRRRALEAEVRSVLAQEAQLATRVPEPGTVAVFPFLYGGADPNLRPLGRALAELLVTDLGQTDRLRVLERTRVQLLLDEIALGESDRTDPATVARSGQLLGAGRVVLGNIGDQGDLLQLQGMVVPVVQAGAALPAIPEPLSERERLEQFFDAQKRLVLGLYSTMGVELTAAERERVNQRPTENIQALLAWGLALEAEDRGDFATAAEQFATAVQLDPGFEAARVSQAVATQILNALQVGTRQLGQTAMIEIPAPPPGAGILFSQGAIEELERLVPSPGSRDPLPEVQGTDVIGGGSTVLVELILRRPR